MEDSGSRYGRENRIWMAQYAEQLLALWSNSLLAYDDEYRMMGRTPPYAAIAGKDADRSHRFLPEEINNRLIDSAAGLFAQEAPALLGAAREKIEKIIVDICGN
jgi:hypothetical protein